jgi:membrane fusion protein (multidrug efflux system)
MASLAGSTLFAPARPDASTRRRHTRLLALTVGCTMALLASAPGSRGQTAGSPPPAAVVVKPVARKPVTPTMSFTGRVEAVDKVDLRARVEGYLQKRYFTEGQKVEVGDLLFLIEPDQYQAKVAVAEADVARAEAAAVNTALQLRRGQELLKNNNIPAATVDERAAADAIAKATVLQEKARLQEARLKLGYTQLFAPVAGEVGRSIYSVGNYVGPASGTLATLVSRDPMYVTFPVTQRELLALRKMAEERDLDRSAIKVRMQLADQSFYPIPGTINFLDIQVSAGTDTVTTRASVPNPKGLLIDGQLVTVLAELGEPQLALFIPQQAVQFDQSGYSVLVVDGENRVKVRPVTLGQAREGEIEVAKGLEEGERVIIDGIQKARPNQIVQATEATRQGQPE